MKITNNNPGMRGVSLSDGTTHWVEPGASYTLAKGDVAHPDLLDEGDKPKAAETPTKAATEDKA